jgi:rhodanese-related sulfurtransferase
VANDERPLVLDVRDKADFVRGFIPNSIFIGLDGSFAPWAGELIPDLQQPILLVAEKGKEAEAVERLSRVGYDNTLGYLAGGIDAWRDYGGEVDTITTIAAGTFGKNLTANSVSHIIDVRKPSEFESGHLDQAVNLPLSAFNVHMKELDNQEEYYLHCGSGYRSTIAASLLKSRGFDRLVNVQDKVADILALETA